MEKASLGKCHWNWHLGDEHVGGASRSRLGREKSTCQAERWAGGFQGTRSGWQESEGTHKLTWRRVRQRFYQKSGGRDLMASESWVTYLVLHLQGMLVRASARSVYGRRTQNRLLVFKRDLNLWKSWWKWANGEQLNNTDKEEWELCAQDSREWGKVSRKLVQVRDIQRGTGGRARRPELRWAEVAMRTGTVAANLVWTRGWYSKLYFILQSNPLNHSFVNGSFKLFLFCFLEFLAFASLKWEFTERKASVKEKLCQKP